MKALTKLLEPAELKAYRAAAESTAKAVRDAETKLTSARATYADAIARQGNMARLLAQLRDKAAELARDAKLDEAQRYAPEIASTKASLAQAEELAGIYGGLIADLEAALIEAEDAAENAHRNLHSQLEDAALPELHGLINGPFLKAWKHSQCAGSFMPFTDWLKRLISDAGANAADLHSRDIDLGAPERPPRAESLGIVEREAIQARVSKRRRAAEEEAAKAAHDKHWAAQVEQRGSDVYQEN